MGSEWVEIKLCEAFEVNPLRSIPRGQITPFIPMDAISGYSRIPDRIDEREFSGSGIKFKNGDTLIARITPCLENGKTIFVKDLPEGVIAHGSTEYIVLSEKSECTYNLFVYYLAISPNFRRYAIGHMEGTSGRQRVPSIALEKYVFQLPPLSEQRAIAHILGTLDDKIELNRKMNETLEAMAQALFKSWFVDFDGVAPEDMRESEMGLIPKGWRIGRLRDVCTVIGGFAFKSKDFSTDGHPVVKIKNISNSLDVDLLDVDYISKEIASKAQKFHLKDGSLVMAMTGATVGKFGLVLNQSELIPVLNQRVALLKPKEDGIGFLLSTLLATNIYDQVVLRAQGSAQPNISADGIMDSELIIPVSEAQMEFSKITNPIFERWIVNKKESLILEKSRDALLPKLISGQLRIKDAEKILGSIA